MKIIALKSGQGKTTQLIRMASKNDRGYIVCSCHKEAYQIMRIAEELKLQINFPLTYSDLLNNDCSLIGVKELYFDDVDRFLIQLARGVPIKAITLNVNY